MTRQLEKVPVQAWLLLGGILFYLASFYVVRFLGFMYAVPLILVLPLLVWYMAQSVIKPILILIPLLVATYLGNVVAVIPEGTVPLTLFQLLLFFTIIVFLLHYLITGPERFRVIGVELELLLILTLISFSIIYTPNREGALLNLTRILFLITLVYLIINILKDHKHFHMIFVFMTIIAVVLGLFSIRATLLDPIMAVMNLRAGGTRIFGRGAITVADPNIFATLFFLPIAFTTSVFLSKLDYMKKIPALLTLLVILAGLASTYSRSAWIAAAFLMLMLVIYYRKYKLMAAVIFLTLVIIISVPELRTMSTGILNRIFDIFSGSTDDSSRIRLLLGSAGMRMLFDSWMIGVGYRGFPDKFTDYFTTQESIGVVEAHNVIYEILAELGIIGFGLLLFFVYRIFTKALQNVRLSKTEPDKIIATTLISTLVAFVIFFQFYGGFLVSTTLWALIGLIFAHGHYLDQLEYHT
ncbi:MAG: O-antigen ligase family protein [Cyclonatronaceae bacterium]